MCQTDMQSFLSGQYFALIPEYRIQNFFGHLCSCRKKFSESFSITSYNSQFLFNTVFAKITIQRKSWTVHEKTRTGMSDAIFATNINSCSGRFDISCVESVHGSI